MKIFVLFMNFKNNTDILAYAALRVRSTNITQWDYNLEDYVKVFLDLHKLFLSTS